MSSTNLTRIEAEQRSQLIFVDHYDISIDLTAGETEFPSLTTVRFSALSDGDTFIDLQANHIYEVLLDEVNITESAVPMTEDGRYDETRGILLQGLSAGEHLLRVNAVCAYSRTGQGLHRFVDPVDNEVYLYTQFETADAKRVFACFDQPDLKATYSLNIIAPTGWKVITNAPQTVIDLPDGQQFSSHIDYPLSTYLVAICAGRYHEVSDIWQGKLTHYPETPADEPTELEIPLSIFCRQSLAECLDSETIFTETKQGFDYYHAHFGVAYPFGKYDQLFVPEFNAGAMENAGCVTFRDEYVFTSKVTKSRYERRCDTILHEMAHMWFGDLVTMRWWDDLWLNESFATWGAAMSQAEATEYHNAWVTFANVEKSWAYQQDQLSSTHPISTDASDIETVEQNFDGITYSKGASVLKQLQAYVGREEFFAGVRRHFAQHAFGNATFADLLNALEQASGRDLSQWAQQWLKTTGLNTLSPSFTIENGVYTDFKVIQSGATPGVGELRTHRVAVGLYSLVDGKVIRTHRAEVDITNAATAVTEFIGVPAAQLVIVNDEDLTYCALGLDDNSMAFLLENIDKINDPMARTLCWSAAWEMTRNQKLRARDFLTLVARGAGTEDQIMVLERLLSQVTTAVNFYADRHWLATEGEELLAQTLLEAALHSEPGSDTQLAFVQALAKVALNEEAAEAFKQILADKQVFPGIHIDADLKWWALTALIADTQFEDPLARIAELLASDNTSSGQMAALRAQAAINTAENKREIFNQIMHQTDSLSNLELRHKLEGLDFTHSDDLLQEFTSEYFECAAQLWSNVSSDVATTTLSGAFPYWDASPQIVELAAAFLEQKDLPHGLRRIIAEGKDRAERGLKNRAFDGS
ncbi:putative aminopeptidase [Corynebacterium kutscheri]|uniref:aminopeptidase N n=1 Tax=Corynebacterium kutscheri TaxID=35755 RepID=UPI000F6DE86A|nr:aminopeptidase N [Corynebacterium kutscheri]VEH82577.1 putative aminopeptidase [Corynebacterium kutscheri]